MKVEVTPTGEPLTQSELERAMAQIALLRSHGVRVVMKPARVRPWPDGRVALEAVVEATKLTR